MTLRTRRPRRVRTATLHERLILPLVLAGVLLLVVILGTAAAPAQPQPAAGDTLARVALHEAMLTAAGGAVGDYFGYSVALDGGTALVGANGAGEDCGAVYVFTGGGVTWTQVATLTAAGGASGDWFGRSVDLDGGTALVGAPMHYVDGRPEQGAAYVFTGSGASWTQVATLTATGGTATDWFGYSVALDDGTALLGAPQRAVDGRVDQGVAYVFTGSGSSWAQEATLTATGGAASDSFGSSVALDAGTALVGARDHDVDGHANQGAAYVFTGGGTSWTQAATLTATGGAANATFGYSVALDGGTALIGAVGHSYGGQIYVGAAYVFTGGGGDWSQQAELTAAGAKSGDWLGSAVALEGDTALVGGPAHDVDGRADQGAAWLFTRDGASWTQTATLTATSGAAGDHFGCSAALGGDTAFVGALFHDVGAHWNQGAVSAFSPACTVTPGVDGGHGAISPATALDYRPEATPTYRFLPDPRYRVAEVTVDGEPVLPTPTESYTFAPLDDDHTIAVRFALAAYQITTVVAGAGSVSPASGAVYDSGATPTYTFLPDPHCHVAEVTLDGLPVLPVPTESYTFAALAADHTLSVRFAPDAYVVTTRVSGAGHLLPWSGVAWEYLSTPTYSFLPDPHQHVEAVTLDGVPVVPTPAASYSFAPIAADHLLTVSFAPDQCLVTASVAGGHGAVSPAGASGYGFGDAPTYVFTPDPHYHVEAVTLDGLPVLPTPTESYRFAPLERDHALTVGFAPDQCVVSASVAGGHGAVSPAGATAYPFGAAPLYRFTPERHYRVGEVTLDGVPVRPTPLAAYCFAPLSAAHELRVSFAPARPLLARLRPRSGARGDLVTLRGREFGLVRGSGTVRFGSAEVPRYLVWTATRIEVPVPEGARPGRLKVRVTTAGGVSTGRWFRVVR